MDLDDLDLLFDDIASDSPTAEQTYKMYGIFLNDFKKTTTTVFGKQIIINEEKSKHPLFKGKFETFAHLVTRESTYSKKRNYDYQRANRIHWIKPILENYEDERILHFERLNDKKVNQHFFWYKERNFIIILREIKPNLLLVTSYCVDKDNFVKYKKWYWENLEQKKTPLRK